MWFDTLQGALPFPNRDRVVFVKTTELPLTPDQIGQTLGALKPDDLVWRAFVQLLDERIGAAVLDNSNSSLPEAKVRAAGGAVEALSDVKLALYRAAGRIPAPQK